MRKIDKKEIEDILVLTPMQEGLLFHYLKEPGSAAYFELLHLSLEGKIETELFEQAWNRVIKANEMLRTVFRWEKRDKPLQVILKQHLLQPGYYDLSARNETSISESLNEIKNRERQRKFDLREVPFRVTLCKTRETTYEMIISSHHILFDGWSLGIILKEFFAAYETCSQRPGLPIPIPMKTRFKEFAHWLQKQDKGEQEKFWREYLEGFQSSNTLSIKRRPLSLEKTAAGDFRTYTAKLERNEAEEFARNNKITLAALLYTTWGLLLQRYTGNNDVVFGITVSGRSAKIKGIENIVGLFINTLPLRILANPHEKITDVVIRVDSALKTLGAYESSSPADIKKYCRLLKEGEFFDSLVAVENYPLDKRMMLKNRQISVTSYAMEEMTHYDLNAAISTAAETADIRLDIIYNTDAFTGEAIGRLANHFIHIWQDILQNPVKEVKAVELLSNREKQQFLIDFNQPGGEYRYPGDKALSGLFIEQAGRTPDQAALVGHPAGQAGSRGQVQLTYRQLNEQSGGLARILMEKGVKPNTIVGIVAKRSLEMIIAVLAILKSGAAYLPLNPEMPAERIIYMLEDSGSEVLVTACAEENEELGNWEGEKIPLEFFIETRGPSSNPLSFLPSSQQNSSCLAYIIYTSGSTGNPKGVPITHANFSPLIHWGYRQLGLGVKDHVIQNLSYYFDWSVWEIFISLTTGSTLYMITEEILLNPEAEVDFIREHAVTVLHITPTQFQYLLNTGEKMTSLQYLFIGAEKLTLELVKRAIAFVHDDCRLFNMYGPTETTVISAVLEINRSKVRDYTDLSSVPIGEPVGNIALLVLDSHLALCPLEVAGELFIAGDGVARGYLNNPDLTSEKFLFSLNRSYRSDRTYNTYLSYKHNTLYRTGDLARWLPCGNVEFLGRKDHQVKIRGYRIEPGEIENRLLRHQDVKEAVVVARQYENGENYLCAYIVPELSRGNFSFQKVREYLTARLPGYMVPALFVRLDKMPLNPNGKVNIDALPKPEIKSGEGYVPPRDEPEKKLVEIWAEILGIDALHTSQLHGSIGITDNFFQLGGHSLRAARMVSMIHKEFDVLVPLQEIFISPTIGEISAYLREAASDNHPSGKWAEKREYYRLSPAQKRLYLLQQMEKSSTGYNMSRVMTLEGNPDILRLEEVFRRLIAKHESFRTSFRFAAGEPVQRICPGVDFTVEYRDITGKDETIKSFIRPFDLSTAPLLRVGLFREQIRPLPSKGEYLLVIDMHHIISDGVSTGVLIRDFMTLYAGEGELFPGRHFTYKDFSQWQHSKGWQETIKNQEEYWLQQFGGEIPVLNLPIDFPRPAVQGFAGSKMSFALTPEETAGLKKLAQEKDATLFMTLLALYAVFLAKLTGQEDLVIGSPVAGRPRPELENIIGVFVNMVALRNYPHGQKTFTGFLEEVKKRTLEALQNKDYPFESLVEKAISTRDASRNPLFDTAFALQDPDLPVLEIPGLKLTPYDYDTGNTKFDLTLIAETVGEHILFTVEYCTGLFKPGTVEGFAGYIKKSVRWILENPGQRISGFEILPEDEKKQLLVDFNYRERDCAVDKTLPWLFRRQVERTPDLVAAAGTSVTGGDTGFVTYREMLEKSAQLAGLLIEKGIRPDTIVGLVMERSIDMITGILGILISGAAYLPINPKNPPARISYLLAESSAHLLVTAGNIADISFEKEVLYLPLENQRSGRGDPGNATHHNLAYIIYTSGSTGNPKGVPVTHANFSQLIHWGYRNLEIGVKDRVIQNLSYYFDWSVWEIFIALTTGAALYMITEEILLNPEAEVNFILEKDINILHITPTQFRYLLSTGKPMPTLRRLFIGAEKLTYDLVKRALAVVPGECRLFNMYGPTEATIIAAVLEIHRHRCEDYRQLTGIPIGRAVGNLELFILDRYRHLCPVKVPGELYIAGDGLARGYLNNPDLTSEKFLLNLNRSNRSYRTYTTYLSYKSNILYSTGDPAARGAYKSNILYSTGDLARWQPSGEIEFLGRLDHQVKIRGYRIELGEIENRLLTYQGVREAVVIDKEKENGEKYLCAYIVPTEPGAVDGFEGNAAGLRRYLAGELPEYMIPAYFIPLERIPLNPNRKVDRNALPGPGLMPAGDLPPVLSDAWEMKLAKIWAEVLGRDAGQSSQLIAAIGANSNFFALGGHSLKASILISQINKAFDVELSLAEVFVHPTIGELAQSIRRAGKISYLSIPLAEKKEYYPLSSAQKRLYILQQQDKEDVTYNIPQVMILEGQPDISRMEAVFRQLIKKHESFRAFFETVKGQPVQRVHNIVEFEIKREWGNGGMEEWQGLVTRAKAFVGGAGGRFSRKESPCPPEANFIRPFDLSSAPLLRVGLLPRTAECFLLLMDMHHIISDGTSMGIFTRDFIDLYEQERVLSAPKPHAYKDFAEWQDSVRGKDALLQHEEYWLNRFRGELPVPELPYDFPRPQVRTSAGNRLDFTIGEKETLKLKQLAHEEEATLFMVLLAIYGVLLSRLTSLEDLVVGTPAAGREQTEFQSVIGMFVNTLAIRSFPIPLKTFKDYLQEIKAITLEAFAHQAYPFEQLVEKTAPLRDHTRHPLFDTMFTWQNLDIPAAEIQGLKLTPYKYNYPVSRFDMTWIGEEIEKDNILQFTVEYSTGLFTGERIKRLTGYFLAVSGIVSTHKETVLKDIDILLPGEREQLLIDFNDTEREYPRHKTIHELFPEQVMRTPDQAALVGANVQPPGGISRGSYPPDEVCLTYREINRESDGMARILYEKGIQNHAIVGIMLERSLEMVIGIIGILKAGAAYLPVDPGYPQERIDYMLKDSKAALLITAGSYAKQGENVRRREGEKGTFFPSNRQSSANLCYIIYTSGSTGQAKGVMVEHKNVIRLVINNHFVPLTRETRILQTGAPVFDATTFEIWGPLLHGGQLYLVNNDIILEANKLKQALTRYLINTLWLSSPLFNQLMQQNSRIFPGLEYLLVGGDVLSPRYIEMARTMNKGLKIINGYGPTENTTFSTTFLIEKEYRQSIPIGKPIANSSVFILDRYDHLVPVGVAGEMLVGGDGVSRGYLNRPQLTAEKFIYYRSDRSYRTHNTYLSYKSPAARGASKSNILYRTGDLARWLPSGDVEFLGRKDHQVKLRGYRIELGEIENRLLKHEKIKETVILLKEDKLSANRYLCAYFAAAPGVTVSAAGLREYLSGHLPQYMVPSYFVRVDKIPLNPNGKVDREKLPDPLMSRDEKYEPPRNDIEKKLVDLWAEVLSRDETHTAHLKSTIGIEDRFFHLGGHSLKVTDLGLLLYKTFHVEFPLVELFARETVREQAEYIGRANRTRPTGIEPVEKKEYYPLSPAQERLYFLRQMDSGSTAYNMPLAFYISKEINPAGFAPVLEKLVARHESLRTAFVRVEEKPVQKIYDSVTFEMEYIELKDTDHVPGQARVTGFIRPFDLARAPLIRSVVIKQGQGGHLWLLDLHHIVSDGSSHAILAEEFAALYNGKALAPLKLQYKDFSRWRGELSGSGRIKAQEEYWLRLYRGDLPRLQLPTDFHRPGVFTFAGNRCDFILEKEITVKFKALGAEKKVTLFMNILAVLNVLFYKYTGQTDIIIGTGTKGRPHADLQGIMGMFVDNLAVRNYPGKRKSYISFLEEVAQNCIEALENKDVPFEELVKKLEPARDLSRNPIFDVAVLVQDFRQPDQWIKSALGSENSLPLELKNNTAKFDLAFFTRESGEELHIQIEYYTGIFAAGTIQRLVEYFKNIINEITRNPFILLEDIEIIPESEKRLLLYTLNDTDREYPGEKTIHQLFSEQAKKTPAYIALLRSDAAMTYEELEKQSGRLARYLYEKKNLQPEDRVGVLMPQTLQLGETLLAILKAGGAYLPLDPSLPEARLMYMINEAGIGMVITDKNPLKNPGHRPVESKTYRTVSWVESGDVPPETKTMAGDTALRRQPGRSLAYIIYTSGTTGQPRGAALEHRGVVNTLLYRKEAYGMNPGVVTLQLFSYSFDGFVTSFFTPLISGAKVVLLEKEEIADVEKLRQAVVSYNVTHFISVPALYAAVIDSLTAGELSGLRCVTLAGDKIMPALLERTIEKNPALEIVNEYGITEGSVMSTINRHQERDRAIKIGGPIWNTRLYVLDDALRLMPIGAAGELCISGVGLARGYLNQPQLTAEKFIYYRSNRSNRSYKTYLSYKSILYRTGDPAARGAYKSTIFYRTGDLARWQPDPAAQGGYMIEFIGRIDFQVKIRGYRIEPAEIERRLAGHVKIKEAVVLARGEKDQERYLCAYIVPCSGSGPLPQKTEISAFLSQTLPLYMIPAYFVFLEKIPLTPNGKIDNKALPDPHPGHKAAYTPPGNTLEKMLHQAWLDVLFEQRKALSPLSIGIDDNFFDLGGHSLKATILAAKIHKLLEVKIPLVEIFKRPTIRELARYLAAAARETFTAIRPVEKKEYYPLSSSQTRFYILQEVTPGSTAYNMATISSLEGRFNKEKFEAALELMVKRHETLRTSFRDKEGEPVQQVHEATAFEIEYYNTGGDSENTPPPLEPGNQELKIKNILRDFIRPFTLSRAPLLRLGLINLSPDRHIFMFDMHHIISDGTSMTLFLTEFMDLYLEKNPAGMFLQYKDVAQWQYDRLKSQALKEQEDYWLGQFSDGLPVLDMPTDFPRPAVQSFEGDRFDFESGNTLTAGMQRLVKDAGVTLYMALLAVYTVLLSRYSGQEDIVIGTTIAGRPHADMQKIIGLFIETLVQRNFPAGHLRFDEFLARVKQNTLEAYDNQDYPFRELIRKLGADNEVSRNPVFDAMLIVQNLETTEFQLEGLTFSPYQPAEEETHQTSKLDITLEAVEAGEKIRFRLEYCTRLYRRETMERLARHFIGIIREVTANPAVPLSDIAVIPGEEKKLLLETFNDTSHKIKKSGEPVPGKTVLERFVHQAEKTPDRVALVGKAEAKKRRGEEEKKESPGETAAPGESTVLPVGPVQPVRPVQTGEPVQLTYRQLNERAGELAYILKENGVGPDTIVGFIAESSLEMAIGTWGILKAGGAYMPIDPGYPPDRIRYIMKDSRTGILVTTGARLPEVEMPGGWEGREIRLEEIYRAPKSSSYYLPPPHPGNLAYIIYTSGTTGHPKGVLVQHGSLANYVKAVENEVDLGPGYTILQQGSICFDAFVEEFYPLLVIGGKVAIPGKMVVRDIPALSRYIARHRVDMISSAPQLINELNKALREGLPGTLLASLKIILVGGDRVKAEYIDKLLEKIEIYNTYGPTESTVCATFYRCRAAAPLPPDIPIGKPLANYKIYLLAKYNNLVPIGVPGELCVGGPGITRGYMNQPQLTAEKFIFYRSHRSYRTYSSNKLYKTGDLARWYPDGNIEFLGRIDRQVKIRGYRIELAEIESRLTGVESIKEAVVVEREKKSGESYLAAYVVSRGQLDTAAVKSHLARHMPDYMIPPYIMAVEAIPWTGTGKIDTKRLPQPEARSGAALPFAPPGNQREKQMAETWKQILEVNQVGIDDNFFDLGGTSLDIIQLGKRINEEWHKQIPVVALFTYTTVRSLVRYLGTGDEKESSPVPGETPQEMEILEVIEKSQNKVKSKSIAVIGMAGKFPGAENIAEFWENLVNGVESIHFFSEEELRSEGIDGQSLENPNYMKARSIITGAEYFDASFFGYNSREAGIMDPQIRVFQQCVWHALEDAGYDPFSYGKRIGMYAGANPNLRWMALTALSGMQMGLSGFMVAQLMDKDFMCTHISYKLDLKGPSYAFQTACSTSLVAVHMAVRALLHGECEMALAGGVSVAFPYKQGYAYQEGMIYSADGHNRTFAAEATGSVFGDGVGAVLLKPLEEAIIDRDHIYALIKGTATNNDGCRKVGYTAPSVQGQVEVIRAAQVMAEVEPESITYVEVHGTATPLGDAVEIAALKQAFKTTKIGYCALSTVKSNVGHLYSAAGAAGFIKAVLALKHRLIPPLLHFTAPNPGIDFENTPFYVNTTLKEWQSNGNPLRAGVSSFGIGGTNAHLVLEEWRPATENPTREAKPTRQYQLVLVSAKTPSALEKQSENLVAFLKKYPPPDMNDMAYTLQTGRKHFPYRRMTLAAANEMDLDRLALYMKRVPTAQVKNETRPVVFMFCGQGSQYENMGRDLYRTEPVFRQEIHRCSEILKPLMHCDIKEVLYPSDPSDKSDQCNRSDGSYRTYNSCMDINRTELTQPVLFAFEYALARLLMHWGIKPWAMIGYSFGEYIAACIAGVISLEDVLKLITVRGELVGRTPEGAMTSVPVPEKDLRPLLNKNLALAIVNGPTCIVSGAKAEVEQFEKEMKQKRVLCVPLNMSQAIHSPLMEPVRREFEETMLSLRLNPPQIPYISNVTARWLSPAEAVTPQYWGDHLCSTVRFSDGLKELLKEENAIFIEIGPGRILGMMVRTHPDKKPGHMILNTVKHQQEKVSDDYFLLEKLGQLWLHGQRIDWNAFYQDEKPNRVPLPGYPFEGKRYWLDIDKTGLDTGTGPAGLPGLSGLPGLPLAAAPGSSETGHTPGTTTEDRENPNRQDENYTAPRNDIETFIASLWQEFLGEKRIGIHDNFFQWNGNSLIAAQLLARLTEEYHVVIPANRFYQEPTIAHLAGITRELCESAKISPTTIL